MNLAKCTFLSAIAVVGSTGALAQESVVRFRLSPASNNAQDCRDLDATLARLHTVTIKAGDAEITAAGGIDGRMKSLGTGMYTLAFELSGLRLDVVADLSGSPAMLTVTERNHGCTWAARPA